MITKRTLRLTALILILLLLAGCGRSASQGSGTSQGTENSTASENNGSGSGQAASEDRDAQSGSSENGDNASASSAPEGEPMASGTDRSGVYEAYAAVVLAKEAEFGKGTVTFDGLLHLTGVGYLALVDLDGDGTEELLLTHGKWMEQTLEIYTFDGGSARQLYAGDAFQRTMDSRNMEIWSDAAGKKYVPVNKGDYFDGKVSFLAFDGISLTEDTEASLASMGDETGFVREDAAELSFYSIEDGDNDAWKAEARERLRSVRARLGLPEEPEDDTGAVFSGEGDVLIDDEALTLIVHGKTMIRTSDGDLPVYCLTAVNHTGSLLELSSAHLGVDFVYDCGTANGAQIIGILFLERQDPAPSSYSQADALTFPGIPAGKSMELYMEILCGGYGIRTIEELVNVSANIHASQDRSGGFWYRDYVLSLDEGETAPPSAEGYTTYEHPYFRFEVPADWKYNIVQEFDDYGLERVWLPPQVNDHSMTYMEFQYDDFYSAEGHAQEIAAFYREDNCSDGDYTVSESETTVAGKHAFLVEVTGKTANTRFRFYYVDLPDGKALTILLQAELPYEDLVEPEYERFLTSIEFS